MAVTSPTSASPELPLLEWDESAVCSWLAHIGLGQYEELIYEHGITGDVLAVMEHESLLDLGMNSIGHRLNLLRGVWELKREQGIEIGEDDWRPHEMEYESPPSIKAQSSQLDRMWNHILEQHERLVKLEDDQSRLIAALDEYGISLPLETSPVPARTRGIPGMEVEKQGNGMGWRDFGGRSDGDEPEAGPSKVRNRASQLFPTSLASSTTTNPPTSADSANFKDSFTPTTASAAYPFESPLDRQIPPQAKSNSTKPPLTRLMSGSSILGASVASPPGAVSMQTTGSQPLISASSSNHSQSLPPSSSHSQATTSPAQPSALGSNGSLASGSSMAASDRDRSRARDAAHNAAKSFRVTLEDPCYKVLPAALKKYKINDDWKMYALFICFGNTERCLSYDEKPLMLFQKLKESGQRPVFMLRHIKDIKSPIAVAQQKQAVKLGLPPNTTTNVLPIVRPSNESSTSPTKGNNLKPGHRADDGVTTTPNGGGFPELPSPGLKDGDGSILPMPKSAGTTGTLVDKDGNVSHVTYAVAIYPYIADRQDEFDVAVGATFVILSKAKGWYIVQKDPAGLGNIIPDQAKSGWVPAGCLIEISAPITILSPGPNDSIPTYPGLSPVPPSAIMSSSYPGIVLMDYKASNEHELSLRDGEKVKVYKKYCHWSYSIKQDTGERGWVPAWFIGKLCSGEEKGLAVVAASGDGAEEELKDEH